MKDEEEKREEQPEKAKVKVSKKELLDKISKADKELQATYS